MRFNELGKLFDFYHRQLFTLAVSITKERASAEDAIHDALVAVAEVGIEPQDLKAYLFKSVRNKALFKVQQRQRLVEFEPEYLEAVVDDEHSSLFARNVAREIDMLSGVQQQIIIMKIFGELTFAEIAELCDMSINTVSSHYRRGVQQLKARLEND
ncbi:RNA polymerase sigma factor [Aliikangiella sp. G2MR2-5]|uniref:RNA polymerase sigma factor n=1 Tax=Aliikangiella sp. G2MR2-5 TaxID=2788943 RepID=UPI0018A9EC11|nr:RNA polymerase sigma factor [Aliikangiella sp. G2MR2-5]